MITIRLLMNLKAQLIRLHTALSEKAKEFDLVIKVGRTQMAECFLHYAGEG